MNRAIAFLLSLTLLLGLPALSVGAQAADPRCAASQPLAAASTGAFSRHAGNGVTQMLGRVLPEHGIYL
jgi:hypothetical protein